MSDFAALSSTTNYLTLLAQIDARAQDQAMALDPANTSVTTPPTKMVRFSSANKRWELYNGSSWVELIAAATDAYNISVTGVRGGNFYGTITNNGTISGGTVNAATLQVGGSNAWTAASLTNLSQLTNGPGFITSSALSPYAPLASPTLTGTPLVPTAAVDTSTTQAASTAYVVNQGYLKAVTAGTTYLPLAGGTVSGALGLSSSFTVAGLITTATPTPVSGITGATVAPLEIPMVTVPAGGVASFTPVLHQRTVVNGLGYVQHVSIGSYRTGLSQWDSIYLGIGGNDSNPTEYWLMNLGGGISHSSGKTFIHSANYNSYAPSLTGTGASGTWGINISGAAASVPWSGVGSAPAITALTASTSATASTVAQRDSSGYLFATYLNQSSSNSEGSTISQILTTNGSDGYLRKNSVAALAAAMSGSTMNINGSAASVAWSGVTGKPINSITTTTSTSTPTGGTAGDFVLQY